VAVGKISKASVDGISPASRDLFLWDTKLPGFGLKVTPAGKRIYVFQYRLGGGRREIPKRFRIGEHGRPWTPEKARAEAERLWAQTRHGIDPAAEKKARAVREQEDAELSFEAVADRFLSDYVKREWKGSYRYAESILRLHVKPILGQKSLTAVTRADCAKVLDRIPSEQIALRRNVYAVLRRLFKWTIGRGIEKSPLDGLDPPKLPASRDRVLNDEELRLAWLATKAIPYPFGPFFRLLTGTGQRREEVAELNWSELNRGRAEWNLPSERAKNSEASIIALSPLMVAELDALADGETWPRRGLVFTTNGKTPISGFSKAKARWEQAIVDLTAKEAETANGEPVQLAPWRVHDLRRTLATGLQRLGVRFEVTEAVLNHVSGSKSGVAGVYQRHDWLLEKASAMEAWATHIEGLLTKEDRSNIVSLADHRA